MTRETNVLELISPLGYPRIEAQASRKTLDSVVGRRVGFIWNQYPATRHFWPHLESAVEDACKPSAVHRAYKSNTWTPLENTKFGALAGEVDYLVIGVGA
jgi:hypothetical protein